MNAADIAVRTVALSLLVTAAAAGGVAMGAFLLWEVADRRMGLRWTR